MGAEDIQRTLGRLEGKLDQLLSEQTAVKEEMNAHEGRERESFSVVSARVGGLSRKIDDIDEKYAGLLHDQSARLEALNDYVARVKGAWWLIGVLTLVIGTAGAMLDWFFNWAHRLSS